MYLIHIIIIVVRNLLHSSARSIVCDWTRKRKKNMTIHVRSSKLHRHVSCNSQDVTLQLYVKKTSSAAI